MYDKLKNWFLNMDEIKDENFNTTQNFTLVRFEITDSKQLNEIGDAFKSNKILLCHISDKTLIRTLDFISGLCFVLNYTDIKITNNNYLFIPETIDYISNS